MRRSLLRVIAAVGALLSLGSGVLALSQNGAEAASVLTFTGLGAHDTVRGSYLDATGSAHSVTTAAGEMLATIDGAPSQGYCIDLSHGIAKGAALPETDWSQMPVPPGRIDSIAWLLNHYYPQTDPAYPLQGSAGQKAAAVQAAIWHFSDGFELGPNNDAMIAANYAAILDAVPLRPELGEPITSLKLQTPDVKHLSGDLVPITVRTTGAGKIVAVAVTDGERLNAAGAPATGLVGDGDIVYVRRSEVGTATVAVSARAEVQKGRIFRVTGTQAQILARSVTVDAKASLSLDYRASAVVRVVKKSFGVSRDATFSFSLAAPGVQEPVVKALTFEGTLEWRDNVRTGVTYELRELATAGWWIAPKGCDGGDPRVLDTGDGFRITPGANQVITCEFHNVQPAKIIVEKRVTDGSPTDQAFSFGLDDGQSLSLKNGESQWWVTTPGAKSVTEQATSGWSLVDSWCTNLTTSQVVKGAASTVQFTLDPGTKWHCVYVNAAAGTSTTTTAPGSTTTAPATTTTVPQPTTTVPSTTAPPTTVAQVVTSVPSTTTPCDSTAKTPDTGDDCTPTDVLGVRESRGTLITTDTAVVAGRLARTGSNRTVSFAGVGGGLVVMGGALFFLGRTTTVTPSFVYVGGRRVRRRKK